MRAQIRAALLAGRKRAKKKPAAAPEAPGVADSVPEEPGVAEAKHAEEEQEAAPETAGWREAKAEPPATPGHRLSMTVTLEEHEHVEDVTPVAPKRAITPRRTLMSSLRASLRGALGDGAAAAAAPAADAAAPAADAAPAAKSAAVELAEEMELRRNECVVCLDAARDATIIHGDTGHMCCCYDCALDLKWRGDPCPMCRLPIDAVIRQYFS